MSTKHFRKYLEDIEKKNSEEIEKKHEKWMEDMNPKRKKKIKDVKVEELENLQNEDELDEKDIEMLENLKKQMERNKKEQKKKAQKTRKKKRGKKNRKQKGKQNKRKKKVKEEEDIDQILEEVSSKKSRSDDKENEKETSKIGFDDIELNIKEKSLVRKDLLNPLKEFRSFFKDQSLEAKNTMSAKKKHREVSAMFFTNSQLNWTPYGNPGISMMIVNRDEETNVRTYSFRFSERYIVTQKSFEMSLNTHNPNVLFQLYHLNPYHVDTILSISEIYKIQSEVEKANEMVERALYVFERCWKKSFFVDLLRGKARLLLKKEDYRGNDGRQNVERMIKANISFLMTLWRRCHAVATMGVCRCAFECSISLFYLTPEHDTCHILLVVDYFAIRGGQFHKLIEFCDWIGSISGELINLSFSKALAYYMMWKKKKKNEVLRKRASDSLRRALLKFPWVLTVLLDDLGEIVNIKEWNQLLKGSIFSSIVCTSKLYSLLLECFIKRSSVLWKDREILEFVKDNVKGIIENSSPYQRIKEGEFVKNYENVVVSSIFGKQLNIGELSERRENENSIEEVEGENYILNFLRNLLPNGFLE